MARSKNVLEGAPQMAAPLDIAYRGRLMPLAALSSDDVGAIRHDLDLCPKNAAGRRQIPTGLRDRIVRYTTSAGLSLRRAARELEISKSLLHTWVTEARRTKPVRSAANGRNGHGPGAHRGPTDPLRHVTVIAPNGLRIEGLTAQEAIDLVRATAS